jgi:hypothetical protein
MELATTVLPSFIIEPPRSVNLGESVSNMKALLEGRIPARDDTPMAYTRDSSHHILAAETPSAAGNRSIVSSPQVVRRVGVLRTIAADQPTLTPQTSASQRRSVTGAVVSDSKTAGTVIPLQLRSPGESLHDMANAMLNLGYAQPRLAGRHCRIEQTGTDTDGSSAVGAEQAACCCIAPGALWCW